MRVWDAAFQVEVPLTTGRCLRPSTSSQRQCSELVPRVPTSGALNQHPRGSPSEPPGAPPTRCSRHQHGRLIVDRRAVRGGLEPIPETRPVRGATARVDGASERSEKQPPFRVAKHDLGTPKLRADDTRIPQSDPTAATTPEQGVVRLGSAVVLDPNRLAEKPHGDGQGRHEWHRPTRRRVWCRVRCGWWRVGWCRLVQAGGVGGCKPSHGLQCRRW
jgi:hypothetical protein